MLSTGPSSLVGPIGLSGSTVFNFGPTSLVGHVGLSGSTNLIFGLIGLVGRGGHSIFLPIRVQNRNNLFFLLHIFKN